jgi:hypothetical protein
VQKKESAIDVHALPALERSLLTISVLKISGAGTRYK